jgi:hypothetical protein
MIEKPPENSELEPQKVTITDQEFTCPNCQTVFNAQGDILQGPEELPPAPVDQPKQSKLYLEELYG